MTTVWRSIPGIPRSYEVSDSGLVRLNLSDDEEDYKLLNQYSVNGYRAVSIMGKQLAVHTLVAKAFLPGEEGEIIVHIDGDNSNNNASNLKWSSYSDKAMSRYKEGKYSKFKVKWLEHGIVFSTLTSASYVTGIPVFLIKNSADTHCPCFGNHFEYCDDSDDVTYISKQDMIKASETLSDISELKENIKTFTK